MSASSFDDASRAPLRIGLALMTAVEIVGQTLDLRSQMLSSLYQGRTGPLLQLVEPSGPVLAIVSALALIGLLAFALDRAPLASGLVVLACMALVSEWITERFGSTPHNMFYPGGMLLGWLAGLWYTRTATREGVAAADREQLAEAGAVGVLAALYVGSGLSKLLDGGGFGWADLVTLRSTILAQQGLGGWQWVETLRWMIIDHPRLAQALAAGGLVIELGGFFLLVGRSLRIVWGLLILSLHLGVFVLCTIPYVEPMFLVPLFTLPWPAIVGRLGGKPASEAVREAPPVTELPVPIALVVLALVLLAASWLRHSG